MNVDLRSIELALQLGSSRLVSGGVYKKTEVVATLWYAKPLSRPRAVGVTNNDDYDDIKDQIKYNQIEIQTKKTTNLYGNLQADL